jgi:hypothetical protein
MNWIKVKSPLIGNDEIDLIQLKVESSNGQKVKSRVLKQYFVLLGLLFLFFYFVIKFFFHIHDFHNILCVLEVIYSIVLLINKKQIFFYISFN